MSGINQTATTTVYINNEAAKTALIDIENKLNNVKKARQEAFEKGDLTAFAKLDKEVGKLESSAEKLRKKFFDVNAVLKDLSGASKNDLTKALSIANAELNKMRRDDPGWEAQRKKVLALRDAVDKASDSAKKGSENTGVFEKSWDKVSGTFGAMIPTLAAAWGAIQFGETVIKSAQAASDEWEAAVSSLTSTWDYFLKSVATWDFSNFFQNMREAAKAGREYAQTLDDLGDKNRALRIAEADAKKYILERKEILRDVTKSEKERIAAADEIIAKEDQLASRRAENAKIEYDAELKKISSLTKLSEEEIKYYLRNYDQLKDNLEIGAKYNETLRVSKVNATSFFTSTTDAALLAGGVVKLAKEEIKNATSEQIKWGKVVEGIGKTADPELEKVVQLYEGLTDAENSALENTLKVKARRSALLNELEKESTKVTNTQKKNTQEAFDFEKFAYELSSKELKEWADDAEKLYNKVADAAIVASEEILNSQALKPSTSIQDSMIAQKEQLDAVLKDQKHKGLTDDLDAQKAILQKNYDEGLVKEDEYQESLSQIKLKKGMAYAEAAQQIAGAFSDFVNAQQDEELAKMETNKQLELKAAAGNAEKEKEIEEKYAKEELKIKKKYADKQFAAQVSQIVAAGALAIMQAFAQLGPIAGAVAAVLIGATTAMQVSTADQERKRVMALKSGGYTKTSLSDNTEADLVQYHANEFVANANAVRNPTIRPVLDVIDMAQRSGTVRTINLPAAVSRMNSRGFKDGGYTDQTEASKQNVDASDTIMRELLITAIQVLNHLDGKIDHMQAFISMEHLDNKYKEWNEFKQDVKRA